MNEVKKGRKETIKQDNLVKSLSLSRRLLGEWEILPVREIDVSSISLYIFKQVNL